MFSCILFSSFLLSVSGSSTPINRTIDFALSHLVDCASSDSDTAKIMKWIDTDVHHQIRDETRQQCEEKWLTCLLPPTPIPRSERNTVRFLLSHLNLCSEAVADSSPTSYCSVILIVLTVLNLVGLTSGFFFYSYRSECKFWLTNVADLPSHVSSHLEQTEDVPSHEYTHHQ